MAEEEVTDHAVFYAEVYFIYRLTGIGEWSLVGGKCFKSYQKAIQRCEEMAEKSLFRQSFAARRYYIPVTRVVKGRAEKAVFHNNAYTIEGVGK